MPNPRNSISPASSGAGHTKSLPPTASRWTRSSPISLAKRMLPRRAASISSSTSRDLPAPDGPRIKTARAPAKTAEAWIVAITGMEEISASQRRQAHDEACAQHFGLAIRPERAGAVLDPDRAAMGIDDLFGDRQAET